VKRGRRTALALSLAWTILTCTALLLPFDPERPLVGRGFDKVVHTGMFTTLGVLAQTALPWISLLFTVPLAIGLECAQRRIPRRNFDRVELYANLVGVGLGTLLAEAACRMRR
jgi:hypothetical protein